MGFLSRFFGGKISQGKDAHIETHHASTSEAQQPLWDVGRKILGATTKCYDKVLPQVSVKDEDTRRESEGGILFELVYFFLYFVLRTTSKNGWVGSETFELEAFLVPKIAWVVIDQFFPDVDSERRKAMMEIISMQWEEKRRQYDSSKIFSPDHQLDGTYVSSELALTISALCGQMTNDALTYTVADLVIQESKNMQLEHDLESARIVIVGNKQ
jgi:hypothetical protein